MLLVLALLVNFNKLHLHPSKRIKKKKKKKTVDLTTRDDFVNTSYKSIKEGLNKPNQMDPEKYKKTDFRGPLIYKAFGLYRHDK